MEANEPGFEWELSKENVRPLKTGRQFSNLKAALQPSSTDGAAKIKDEKQKFELELRTYNGDDPLSVWYDYIMWTEQNYPKGGSSQLSQLLEQCIAQYKDDEKYKNDQRFLKLWIKFAQLCTDPREIYSFMYNQGICSGLASFYETWASDLEIVGNTKKADTVYQQGIGNGAQPLEWLIQKHRNFQARVVARASRGETSMEVGPDQQEDAENRVSLGVVRTHGRSKKVGSIRTPLSKPAVLQAPNTHKPASNVQGPAFTIFQDQENIPASLPPQTKQWAKVPIQSQVNRENERKAGKWTEAQVRPRPGFSGPPVAPEPTFRIHEDENVPQPQATPRRVNLEANHVLSARKQKPVHDPLEALRATPAETKQIPMYCKHLVYTGAEEFSLEEIRAAYIIKKQEQIQMKKLEEERRQVEAQLRAQQEELAAIVQQKLRMEQEMQEQQKLQHTVTEMEGTEEPERPVAMTECDADLCTSDSMSTQKLLAFHLSSTSLQDAGSGSMTDKSILNRQTPETSVYGRATPQSGKLTAPSPTVNTRDAMRLVNGLFNQSIPGDNMWGRQSSSVSDPPPSSVLPRAPPAAAPFSIFVDENEPPSAKKIDEDEENLENRPPSGYENGPKRRVLSGILQPSADIPVAPPGAHPEDMDDEDDDGDILAQPLSQDEPVDCMDGGAEFADLTFAPYCSSTRNFTAITKQLAATRFLDTMDVPYEETITAGAKLTSATQMSSAHNVTRGSTQKATSMITSQTASMEIRADGSKRSDTFGSLSNLSAIRECSDEMTKAGTTTTTTEISELQALPSKPHPALSSTRTADTSDRLQTSTTARPWRRSATTTASASLTDSMLTKTCAATSMNQTCHEIDVTNYVAEEDAVDLLSQSVMVNPDHDPFDEDLLRGFLAGLERPLETYAAYHAVSRPLPAFRARAGVLLGSKNFNVVRRIGEGNFGKVYEIQRVKEEDPKSVGQVVKVQSPACPWEFYVVNELHERLGQLRSPLSAAFMKIDEAYMHNNGSCFLSQLMPHGTLLDVMNAVRASRETMAESLSVLLAIQLLRILESLMSTNIIHGDIKPDNFLFRGFPQMPEGSSDIPTEPCVELIDFGRSIDMKMFPEGTTFSVNVDTTDFQCVEMMTNRPWTYQTDMFGVVGTLNVLIFGNYMKVRLVKGRWKTNFQFKRWFLTTAAMTEVFDRLLNVPSCTEFPDVGRLRRRLEDEFRRHHSATYNKDASMFMSKHC